MTKNNVQIKEAVDVAGVVTVKRIFTIAGRRVSAAEFFSRRVDGRIRPSGEDGPVNKNLVVNTGRALVAAALRKHTQPWYIDRIQFGDCVIAGSVQKTSYPADLSDTSLVHELTDASGQKAGTFALDSDTSPDEVVKVSALVGTPGVLTAGSTSLLTDPGADFTSAGISTRDTVTVVINGIDYVLGVNAIRSQTELEVANPGQVAGACGYSVQTPGTQALFTKLVKGDSFPVAVYGNDVVIHEAGLFYNNGGLFNRVTFYQGDNATGLRPQPTDAGGGAVDLQFDWLITI